jgi:hypothetical protein
MLEMHQIEELIRIVSAMERDVITDRFLNHRGRFPVDFTPEFLDQLPLDRLRHVYVAYCLQTHTLPDDEAAAHAA